MTEMVEVQQPAASAAGRAPIPEDARFGYAGGTVDLRLTVSPGASDEEWADAEVTWRAGESSAAAADQREPIRPRTQLPDGDAVRVRDVIRARCTPSELSIDTFRPRNKKDPNTWVLRTLTFTHRQPDVTRAWTGAIERAIAASASRPQRLLVLVNPVSGSGRATRIWRQVSHLTGGIRSVQVVNTTHRGHAAELTAAPDLADKYDGVLCVGGDGLLMEAVNGWMKNPGRAEAESSGRRPRFAPIPAGSTDCTAVCLHGTRDPVTAVMRVVVGDRVPVDLARCRALESGEETYAANACMYGFFADTLRGAERVCCTGHARYSVAGAGALAQRKRRDVGLRYVAGAGQVQRGESEGCCCCMVPKRKVPLAEDQRVCRVGAAMDAAAAAAVESRKGRSADVGPPGQDAQWQPLTLRAVAVNVNVLSCRGPDTPDGVASDLGLCDGELRLQWCEGKTRCAFLRFLMGLAGPGKDQVELRGVGQIPCTAVEFTFPAGSKDYRFNVDGELWPSDPKSRGALVWAVRGAIDCFARGPVL